MTARLVATTTLGGALPVLQTLQAAAIAPLQAQVDGLLTAQARLSVTPLPITKSLEIAQELVVRIQEAIGVGTPEVDGQLAVIATALAGLRAAVAALDVGLGAGGVSVYRFTGPAASIAPELEGVIGAGPPGSLPEAAAGAVLLVATTPEARAALGAACGVTL
jgi:hypothetical protein